MNRHGKAAPLRHLWAPQTTGGPRMYKINFLTKEGRRQCPVDGCPGVSETRAAMRVHFLHRNVHDTVVILEEGNLPLPRCRGRSGARSAPASLLVSLTPPGIHPLGTSFCLPSSGNSFCTSWAPQSSVGPRGVAVVRPFHVESSGDSTRIQPRVPPHTPRTPLSLSVFP